MPRVACWRVAVTGASHSLEAFRVTTRPLVPFELAHRHHPRHAGPRLPSCIYRCIFPERFSWDARKSIANLAVRGFDFAFASLIFDGSTLERVDDRREYGESRFVAIGLADGLHLTVVYTDRESDRGTVRRIISARRSNRRERQAYDEAHDQEA